MSERVTLPVVEEKCETCKFWQRGTGKGEQIGECLRYPPVPTPFLNALNAREKFGTGDGWGKGFGVYGDYSKEPHQYDAALQECHNLMAWGSPTTCEDDWCGEWQAKAVPEVDGRTEGGAP